MVYNRTFSIIPKHVLTAPILIGIWLSVAVAISASGFVYGVPAPILGATNGLLIILSLFTIYFVQPIRSWVMNLDLKWLILYHTVRFVGIAFLVYHAKGIIPSEFAIVAGWGDIAVAVTALVVAGLSLPVTSSAHWRWRWVLIWNLFGLLDILYVLKTGIGLGLQNPDQMIWITTFPFSLLPMFIVPLIIVTHILIFVRLWQISARLKPLI